MLIIGLTGGIGSGKTTVANMFARKGVPLIDTDEISRNITRNGCAGYLAIVEHFGNGILDDHGELDRDRLRAIVFADDKSRNKLESLLHPLIRDEVRRQLNRISGQPYCVVIVPLLFEAGFQDLVHRILVVDSPETRQIERVIKRDEMTPDQVRDIMRTQLTGRKRTKNADDIISNNDSLQQLSDQVDELHRKYEAMASEYT